MFMTSKKMTLSTVLIGLLFMGACDSGSSNQSNASSDHLLTPVNKKLSNYGNQPTKNTWPALSGDEVAISDDILAPNYYIVFDGSGSMKDDGCSDGKTKLAAAKVALGNFVSKIPSNANVGLLVFDVNRVAERVSLSSQNRSQVLSAISSVVAGSGTPLRSSIGHGYNALHNQAKKQLGYGEYNLVVVTDGQASEGEDPTKTVNSILGTSPVLIHTIGFCIDSQHSLNQPGATYYRAANNPQSLQQGLEEILAEAPGFDVDNFGQN